MGTLCSPSPTEIDSFIADGTLVDEPPLVGWR